MGRTSLDEIVSSLYNRLPRALVGFVPSFAEPAYVLVKRGFSTLSQLRQPVLVLEGQEKQSKETLVAAVIGPESTAAYLTEKIYSGNPRSARPGKVSSLRIGAQMDTIPDDCSLVFIELDEVFRGLLTRRGIMVLPAWPLFPYHDLKFRK